MTSEPVQVAVIGGGPAGCAAAITLARRGVRVILIESRRFPRPKVCGEYISPAATEDLEALLTKQELHDAGAQRVERLSIAYKATCFSWNMPSCAWVLSRTRLDTLLLERAVEQGVVVRTPETVRTVVYNDHEVELTLTSDEHITAAFVIHADGTGRHDLKGPTPIDKNIVGLKCHLRTPEPIDGLVMRPAHGAYAGVLGIEGGAATCALVARSELVRAHNGDRDALLRSIWPEYQTQWRISDWMACPVPRGAYRGTGHPRSFRVGNAAAAIDPVGGEGIGNGLWAGRMVGDLLADWLADWLSKWMEATGSSEVGQASQTEARRALAGVHRTIGRRYASRMRMRLPACRLAAITLMRPVLAKAVARVGSLPLARSATILPWMMFTGKPLRA